MLDVSIFTPRIKKSVSVRYASNSLNQLPKAILLGSSGERLRIFSLTEENNELSLDGFDAGVYTLRIEAGSEVMAKQIIIP